MKSLMDDFFTGDLRLKDGGTSLVDQLRHEFWREEALEHLEMLGLDEPSEALIRRTMHVLQDREAMLIEKEKTI